MWRTHKNTCLGCIAILQGLKCVMPYPSVKGSVVVEAKDLGYLQPGEWLNDVAVDFYIK